MLSVNATHGTPHRSGELLRFPISASQVVAELEASVTGKVPMISEFQDDDDWSTSAAWAVISQEDNWRDLTQVTPKIPPAYTGKTSWFAYEEAVDDWIDITTLEPSRRGPSLKNRLFEEAAVYKPLLDRERLKDPEDGVQYF